MKKIILIFFIPYFYNSYSQTPYEHFKININEKLQLLSGYTPFVDEEDTLSFDPDSLLSVIAGNITDYLKSEGFKDFNVKDFPLLEYVKSENPQFEVLIAGYHCGGTAGWIPRSVIIKHTNDKPSIYNIDSESYFYEFYTLKDELYLCIGSAPGSSICRGEVAYAIEFSEQTYSFRPVFDGKHFFSLCNADFTFDEKENIFTAHPEFLPYKDEEDTYLEYLSKNGYTNFSIKEGNEEICDSIFVSKFDGMKFVSPD